MAKSQGDTKMMDDSEGEDDSMDDSSQDLTMDLPRHFLSVSPRGEGAGVDDDSPLQEVRFK